MGRKPFAGVQLSVTFRLLCSLSVSLAVTDHTAPSRPLLCLWDRCLLMSTCQLDGYLHLSFPHSPDEHCPQQPDSHRTSGSTYMVKKSHPVYTPTSWSGTHGWARYGNRRNCFINHLLPYTIQRLHRRHWESDQIFSGLTGAIRLPGWSGFTKQERARPTDHRKGKTLPLLEWRMLLLYKPTRNTQGQGPTAKGTNHKKERKTS